MGTPFSAARNLARKSAWACRTAATPGDAVRLVGAYAVGRAFSALAGHAVPRGLRAHRFGVALRVNGREVRMRLRLDWGDLSTLVAVFQVGGGGYRMPAFDPGRRTPPVVVDLGANIGLVTLLLSTLLPAGARFVCVEPDPANLELLRENVAANGLNATVLPLAVGPRRGRAPFHRHAQGDAHTLDVRPHGGPPLLEVIEVETAPLGEILDEAGVDRMDALKVDIEGAERSLCDDAPRWAHRVQGPLWIEIHDRSVNRAAVLADLERAGFRPATWAPGPTRAWDMLGFVRPPAAGPLDAAV